MMGGQLRRRALVSVVLALCSGAASADPASLIMLGASWMANGAVWYVAAAWLAGGAIVSSALRRSEQRAANRAARAKAINDLQARTVTALQADPAWRVVYGEATVGGDIHAIITHDKTNGKREDGSTYTRPDAYKSLVIVWADHQCKGVKTILINGIDIGAVDASGWVTGGTYMGAGTESRNAAFAAGASVITVSEPIVDVLSLTATKNGTAYSSAYTISADRKTVTVVSTDGPAAVAVSGRWLNYTVNKGVPRVRVEHYRGTSSQTASTYLIAQAPAQWTAGHRLRGKCYSVVTLDLEDTRFMGGWGDILAVVEGHDQIYDPRTATAGYSTNPALICNNWLLSPWGYGADVTTADIDQARLIAAANACDVSTNYTEGTTTITGPRYTCNGGFNTDQGKEPVLEDLRESMAGHVPFDGQWLIDAGAWSTPVLALTDADLAGPIELVQAGSPSGELFNSIRTQYLPPLAKAVAEADPYVNATLVAADGKSLWGDLTLPFTNTKARCRQIARVVTERSRDGQILRIPLKRRALRLQVGDRFTLTNTEYGLTAKTYRATDISVVPQGGLVVTAQEDAADVYDTADASSADPNPNTGLQSPLVVAAMGALTVTSGTAELVLLKDGTVVPRVKIAWAAVQDPYVVAGGFVETRWRAVDSIVWNDWRQAPGDALSVYLDGMTERLPIIIEARLRNSMGYLGASAYASHVVVGKLAAPTNVANLIATVSGGQAIIAMDPCPDADYAETEVRIGNTSSTWATATRLGIGNQNLFGWSPFPALGSYNVFAVHYDTSGNASTPQAIVATVTTAGISSAASGTNVFMNGDFDAKAGPLAAPDGYAIYLNNQTAGGAWAYNNDTGRDGTGKCFSLRVVTGASFAAGGRVGLQSFGAYQSGLVTGGAANGWRAGKVYTISFWYRVCTSSTAGPTAWSGTAIKPSLYNNIAPATIEVIAAPAVSHLWQQCQLRITWGATVENDGGLYIGLNNGSGTMPTLAANDLIMIDDLMVSMGSDFPPFERSPQDDLRAASILTAALALEAATSLVLQDYTFTYNTGAAGTYTENGTPQAQWTNQTDRTVRVQFEITFGKSSASWTKVGLPTQWVENIIFGIVGGTISTVPVKDVLIDVELRDSLTLPTRGNAYEGATYIGEVAVSPGQTITAYPSITTTHGGNFSLVSGSARVRLAAMKA